ncbi:hypothetical protein GP486_001970 [Trichoglossum hirsutum]|uniref:JmjC domain-containing protein n=1 Tax=Trichoglossum hirsutum TaxID=265104 RepID=A0A9P8LG44_9PEZI|nr:hypothetical protein GP486_001970 [Trichoglossum hirsutum]
MEYPGQELSQESALVQPDDKQDVSNLVRVLKELSSDLKLERYTTSVERFIRLLEISEPADRSNVHILHEDKVADYFGRCAEFSKPIFTPGNGGEKSSITIQRLFEFFKNAGLSHTEVDVQDPSNPETEYNYSRKTMAQVREAFGLDLLQRTSQGILWNILDLANHTFENVTPAGLTTDATQFLKHIKVFRGGTAHRDEQDLNQRSWKCLESWLLLSMQHSISLPHQDGSGLCTWVKSGQGRKLWLICYSMTDDEKEEYGRQGPSFCGGRWLRLWLHPGDTLFMPSSTVHAVYTDLDGICVGGHFLLPRFLLDCLAAIWFEIHNDIVTNDHDPGWIRKSLHDIRRMIEIDNGCFGEESPRIVQRCQVGISLVYLVYYINFLQLILYRMDTPACNCKSSCTGRCGCSKSKLKCMRSCHGGTRCPGGAGAKRDGGNCLANERAKKLRTASAILATR